MSRHESSAQQHGLLVELVQPGLSQQTHAPRQPSLLQPSPLPSPGAGDYEVQLVRDGDPDGGHGREECRLHPSHTAALRVPSKGGLWMVGMQTGLDMGSG